MPNVIKQITLSGVTYDLVDQGARDLIDALGDYAAFIGVTTSDISDGSSLNPIVINGEDVEARTGDICTKGSAEFIWNGSAWQAFGDLSALGELAYKDSASATYTPQGTVSQPTFSGSELTSTGNFTPSGSVAISTGSGEANYTPAGSVSQPTFSGSEFTSTGNFTPAGSVAISTAATGTANYTPAGTVSTPTITVTPSTDSVYSITDVGTLPTFTADVTNENLTLSFTQGTLPTKGSAQTVVSGITSATATQPTFTGTGAVLEASFTGTQGSVSVAGTATGTVSQPTFSGTGVDLEAAFTGTQGSVSVTGTPAGTVSQPSFTGTEATITVS